MVGCGYREETLHWKLNLKDKSETFIKIYYINEPSTIEYIAC